MILNSTYIRTLSIAEHWAVRTGSDIYWSVSTSLVVTDGGMVMVGMLMMVSGHHSLPLSSLSTVKCQTRESTIEKIFALNSNQYWWGSSFDCYQGLNESHDWRAAGWDGGDEKMRDRADWHHSKDRPHQVTTIKLQQPLGIINLYWLILMDGLLVWTLYFVWRNRKPDLLPVSRAPLDWHWCWVWLGAPPRNETAQSPGLIFTPWCREILVKLIIACQ